MIKDKYKYWEYCLMGAAGILVYAPMEAIKGTFYLVTSPLYLVGKGLKTYDPYCMDQPTTTKQEGTYYESIYKR